MAIDELAMQLQNVPLKSEEHYSEGANNYSGKIQRRLLKTPF